MANHSRPLSPHLQVYRPQLTTVLSITHRGTGLVLSAGLVAFVAWLLAAAAGPAALDSANAFFVSIPPYPTESMAQLRRKLGETGSSGLLAIQAQG